MNSGWCLWSTPFHKEFRKRPDRMRCDLIVACFSFPPLNCIPPGHSADCLGHPITCRFTCWIPGFVPQLPQPLTEIQEMI
jgi:hypothetical protein